MFFFKSSKHVSATVDPVFRGGGEVMHIHSCLDCLKDPPKQFSKYLLPWRAYVLLTSAK